MWGSNRPDRAIECAPQTTPSSTRLEPWAWGSFPSLRFARAAHILVALLNKSYCLCVREQMGRSREGLVPQTTSSTHQPLCSHWTVETPCPDPGEMTVCIFTVLGRERHVQKVMLQKGSWHRAK